MRMDRTPGSGEAYYKKAMQPLIMNARILCIVMVCAIAVLLAGCTQQEAPPAPVTTVPTTQPVTTPVVTQPVVPPTPDYLTGPIPRDKDVAVAVDRDAINPIITMTYRGGQGINAVVLLEFVITRSDGLVLRDSLGYPGPRPQVNNQMTLEGTREVSDSKADRVQVFVTYNNGDKYLLFDQVMPFRSRG